MNSPIMSKIHKHKEPEIPEVDYDHEPLGASLLSESIGPINFLENFKNIETKKPFPRAVVDFLKESTRNQGTSQSSRRKKSFCTELRSTYNKPTNGVLSLNKSKSTNRNFGKSPFKINPRDSDVSSSISSMKPVEKPKMTDFEKVQKRAKMEAKANNRILRDLARVQSPIASNVELEHKLAEVRRFAMFKKYQKCKPFKRAAMKTQRYFHRNKDNMLS